MKHLRCFMGIGETFKKYRELYDLSQEKLSKKMKEGTFVNCSKSTISRIENGRSEPSFEFILTFIKVICENDPNTDISLFSFIPDGFDKVKKIEDANVKILSKAINNHSELKTNTYVNELFNETIITGNTIPKYLLSFDKTKMFLDNLYDYFQIYKKLLNKKLDTDKMIKEHPEQKYDKKKYNEDIEKPMSNELTLIRKDTDQFLKDFLDYYCNPLKKPTE